ncbi:hypothetical protein ESZ50_05705 [Weissella muntiaci]|uniref:Uncharacterized protein n=1 Tax=Weissella muntiaci TaxID=2508881 RepID=A0A6C2C6W1_9LACO|nr:hypothetical protein [Weissella muntiaci]TYC49638.1 hypothetical protein ESZ50_05705 [Weissella muntiaci]
MSVNSNELVKAAVDFINETGEPFVNLDTELSNGALRIVLSTFSGKDELENEPHIEPLKQQVNALLAGLVTLQMMRTEDEVLVEMIDDILHDVKVIREKDKAEQVSEVD